MVQLLKQGAGKLLNLPGRRSREAVSGALGSHVSLRIVEIAPHEPGETPRGPHLHRDFEECIYVLAGHGTMHAESGEYPAEPGDILLVPAGEKHMTLNAGREPLVLLCFFAVPDVGSGTVEFTTF